MSNDSSHSMPWFSGDSYNRVLVATPPEDSPPDFFYSPKRTFVLVNRPLPGPITPKPISPAFDFSQRGQRVSLSLWSTSELLRDPHFRYSEMTQDSGCFTYQESHRVLSPAIPSATSSPPITPGVYALNVIAGMVFSPSPLRQLQMDEWLHSLSPIHLDASPDMFSPTTPMAYALNVVSSIAFPPSPPRQTQTNEWLRSLTQISPSMLNIMRSMELFEFDILIFGRLFNTSQPFQNVTDWDDDGYNDLLSIHMLALEEEWYTDGADEVLNLHMDVYESREGE